MNPEIEAALSRNHGVFEARRHPGLRSAVRYAVARGRLIALFSGVYTTPALATMWQTKVVALACADPNAVLRGPSAAYVWGWRREPPAVCTATTPLRTRPGYELSRRGLDADSVTERGGVRVTTPSRTALDLALQHGPDGIDLALRQGVTLTALHRTLAARPYERGNTALRTWLRDSRDEPWSHAERVAHRALHASQVRGWAANVPLRRLDGRTVYLDIAFRGLRLAIEIDGRLPPRLGDPHQRRGPRPRPRPAGLDDPAVHRRRGAGRSRRLCRAGATARLAARSPVPLRLSRRRPHSAGAGAAPTPPEPAPTPLRRNPGGPVASAHAG